MTQAKSVHSTPRRTASKIQRPKSPLPDSSPELTAALLGFVACGLQFGASLEEMETAVFDELERARKLAAKNQRRTFRIEGSRIVSSVAVSAPG